MKWVVAVSYMKMVAIEHGVYAHLQFTYGLPNCYITFVDASSKEEAIQIGIENAKIEIADSQIIYSSAVATMLPTESIVQTELADFANQTFST